MIKKCLSTHGASGYAPGSDVHNGRIICGLCKRDISNDVEIKDSIYRDYKFMESPIKWMKGERKYVGMRTLSLKDKIKMLESRR